MPDPNNQISNRIELVIQNSKEKMACVLIIIPTYLQATEYHPLVGSVGKGHGEDGCIPQQPQRKCIRWLVTSWHAYFVAS